MNAGRLTMDNNAINPFSENGEFDAFSAGIEPGGLRNTTQIKVLITFIAGRLKEAITSDMLLEALQMHGLANYFEATQALDELLENGSLIESEGRLHITPKGTLAVAELSDDVPRTVKETALADAIFSLWRSAKAKTRLKSSPAQTASTLPSRLLTRVMTLCR